MIVATRPAATGAAGRPREEPTRPRVRFGVIAVAALSAGAAAIHAAVIPEHAREYWPFAVFFAGVTLLQGAWAFAVVRHPSHRSYLVGGATSAALVGLWLVSRTAGIPLGPEPWQPEPVALLDILATVLEVGIIVAVAGHRHPDRPSLPST